MRGCESLCVERESNKKGYRHQNIEDGNTTPVSNNHLLVGWNNNYIIVGGGDECGGEGGEDEKNNSSIFTSFPIVEIE